MHKHANASRTIAIHFSYAFAKTFNFNAGKNVLKGLKDTVKFPHSSYAYIYIYTLTHRQSAYFIAVLSSINPTILHLSHAIAIAFVYSLSDAKFVTACYSTLFSPIKQSSILIFTQLFLSLTLQTPDSFFSFFVLFK